MNTNRMHTFLLVIAAVTLLVALAFHVRIGAMADAVAVLKTMGMTCGGCSEKITLGLETLKGVAATEVNVDGGWVIVAYDSKAVRPEDLAEKVRATGYASNVYDVVTPEAFRKIAGRDVGQHAASAKGCGGGCGGNKL